MHPILLVIALAGASQESPPPECAIEATWRDCMSDADNKAEMLACHRPALRGARVVLVAELDELHRRNAKDRPELDARVDEAHRAWWRAMDADCAAVSQEWDGGSLRDAMVSHCFLELTLARIRWLRRWHGPEELRECPAADAQ